MLHLDRYALERHRERETFWSPAFAVRTFLWFVNVERVALPAKAWGIGRLTNGPHTGLVIHIPDDQARPLAQQSIALERFCGEFVPSHGVHPTTLELRLVKNRVSFFFQSLDGILDPREVFIVQIRF